MSPQRPVAGDGAEVPARRRQPQHGAHVEQPQDPQEQLRGEGGQAEDLGERHGCRAPQRDGSCDLQHHHRQLMGVASPWREAVISGYATWSLNTRDSLFRSLKAAAAQSPAGQQGASVTGHAPLSRTNHSLTWPRLRHEAAGLHAELADRVS